MSNYGDMYRASEEAAIIRHDLPDYVKENHPDLPHEIKVMLARGARDAKELSTLKGALHTIVKAANV